MEKRIALLVVIFIVIGISSSIVMALPPMGPPRALVGQDRWALGVGFSHSTMNLDAFGKYRQDEGLGWVTPPEYTKYEIEDLTSNTLIGRLSYGAYDTVDVFVCLGLSDAQDDVEEVNRTGGQGDQYSGLECGHGFAWGFGARANFWQEGDIAWGGLVQILWQNPSDGDITLSHPTKFTFFGDPNPLEGDVELDIQEIQVAVGPTVQLESFCVYGGPFLHIISGDLDIDVSGTDIELGDPDLVLRQEFSGDIEERSEFGFFAGAQGDIDQDTAWYAEFQITGDAWGIGVGGVRKF